MWSLASSAFGRWETPTFLAFPGLPRPRSLTRFNIMPGTIFWYFWRGIIWPQLTVKGMHDIQKYFLVPGTIT